MSGTFVSVGNAKQPFSRLLDAVIKIKNVLPKPIVVQHGHTPFSDADCQAIVFMEMDKFSEAVTKADVLIIHAGAGSAIHAIRAGKIPIIMPRRSPLAEHIDDHQVEFTEVLAEQGKAILAETHEQLIAAVEKVKNHTKSVTVSSESLMVKLIKDELQKLATEINGKK